MKGIIWNKSKLKKYQHLESDTVKLIASDDLSIVDFSKFQLLIIPAELEHHQKEFDDFYGFTLIRDFRLKFKLTIPIVILSVLPKSFYLDNFSVLSFQVLRTPGHYFFEMDLELDWNFLLHEPFEGIDEDTLNDINNTFFTVEGVVDEEFHDLKNKAFKENSNNETTEELFEHLLQDIQESFSKFKIIFDLKNNSTLSDIQERLIADLKKSISETGDYDTSIVIINNYIGEIKRLLPSDKKNELDLAFNQVPPWEILFVDDDPAIARRIQTLFKEKLMTCHIAHSGEETFKILKDDKENNITVLICDYRLLNEDKTWQKWQGYNILKEVFLNFPNELSFFTLTSFNKRTLIRMQAIHQMKVRTASKDDVIGKSQTVTGFNLFADQVQEEGDKVFDLYRSQPKAASWVKGYRKFDRPLRTYYRMHRLAKDVGLANQQIEIEAEAFFQVIQKSKHENIRSENVDILPIQEGIGVDKKTKLTEEEKLERFRIKLVGRRIAIALFDRLEMNKGQIYSAMKSGWFRPNPPRESDNTINQFFSTYMALSLEKDIPKNLLPEEKHWLKQLAKK